MRFYLKNKEIKHFTVEIKNTKHMKYKYWIGNENWIFFWFNSFPLWRLQEQAFTAYTFAIGKLKKSIFNF